MKFDVYIFLFQISSVTVIVQLEIELRDFKRFRSSYKTDKYLSVMQWEEIERTLAKSAKLQMKIRGMKEPLTGTFQTDDPFESLHVTFKVVPKSESYINFDKLKFEYNLEWIMQVKISKSPLPQPEPAPVAPAQYDENLNQADIEYSPEKQFQEITSLYVPSLKSEQSSETNIAPIEYSPPRFDNSVEVQKYTPSRIKQNNNHQTENSEIVVKPISLKKQCFGSDSDPANEEEDPTNVVPNSEEENFEPSVPGEAKPYTSSIAENTKKRQRTKRMLYVESPLALVDESSKVEETNVTKRRKKKAKSDKSSPNQPKITTMMKPEENSPKIAQSSKCLEATKPESTLKKASSKSKPVIDSKALEIFDPETMVRLKKFVDKVQEEEIHINQRKEELKDYDMYNCNEMTDDELKE